MGLFDAIDKLANAGARSVMPAEKLARAKDQALATNQRNELAMMANGYQVSKAAQRAAKAQLVDEVGEAEAAKLMKQSVHKVRNSFAGGGR